MVEVPAPSPPPRAPRHQDWHALIRELTRQLDGHLVYDRHLAGIAHEIRMAEKALDRRGMWSNVRWSDVTPPIYTRPDGPSDPAHPRHPRGGDTW